MRSRLRRFRCMRTPNRPLMRLRVVGLLCSSAGFVACTSGPIGIEEGDENVVTGAIAAVEIQNSYGYVQLDSAVTASGLTYPVLIVAVSESTEIVRERLDGSLAFGNEVDLVVGALTRVLHSGTLIKTDPPRVDAIRVQVMQSANR